MPSIEWNRSAWGNAYQWDNEGEEWSKPWGGSEAQWFGSIYPRIHNFLPAKNILEIAPGYGRWTRFLLAQSHSYSGVDIAPKCIEKCRNKFDSGDFFVNDGKSLDMIEDNSIDFVYSFDSLVHASIEVFESYIPQILNKLTVNGAAFLHHSNLGALFLSPAYTPHMRDPYVSGDFVANLVEKNNGNVLVQEVVNWRGDELIDCFTLFAKNKSSIESAKKNIICNNDFMREAANCSMYIQGYSQFCKKNTVSA